MQILLDKVKADKKLVVAANMDLNEAEAKTFWPMHDAYQKELQAINERVGKMPTGFPPSLDKTGSITSDCVVHNHHFSRRRGNYQTLRT